MINIARQSKANAVTRAIVCGIMCLGYLSTFVIEYKDMK